MVQNDMKISFMESQRFSQRWLWVILILTMLLLVGVFGYGLFQQLVLGEPWGERPLSDVGLLLAGTSALIFSSGLSYLFYSLRLITEVRPEGLIIRFYPLRRKFIPYHQIKTCQARTYKPLREYGGWGIKYGPAGWAYSILGDRGVQLVLVDGTRVLIGSQRAEELQQAIKRYCVG
jgi:hypothetical protein